MALAIAITRRPATAAWATACQATAAPEASASAPPRNKKPAVRLWLNRWCALRSRKLMPSASTPSRASSCRAAKTKAEASCGSWRRTPTSVWGEAATK
ncbi:MAG: hypothetical protein DIU82_03250 [Bacillota bacterium]|nr:MAG: hypothetical protein DIU82_03250 [Bacillota bacterium]